MSEVWPLTKVGDCCDILDNLRVPLNAEEREGMPGDIPYYGANGLQGYIDNFIFDEPLILLAEDGGYFDEHETRPIAYRIYGKSWVNNHAHVLRVKTGCPFCQDFIFYSLQHKNITPYIKGGTRAKLNQSELRDILIPSPPDTTQHRIAEILSTLDEAIEQTESLIAKMQQVKAGMMHDLFTRGVTPNGRLRPTREQAPELYKESPLGWIPQEWEVALISEAFDIQLGKMLNKLAKTGKGSAPYLGNRAVKWDFVDCTEIEVMDFTASERVKFSLNPGDLLVCEGGDVGRTAIWRGEMKECFYQKAIHRLRPKSGAALPAFMLRFMRFAKESGCFREFTSQSSIAHLTQEKLGAIPMLLPRPDEQSRIAKRFDAVDEQIQNEISKLAKLRDQKHGLMHDLLTGRVQASSTASDRSDRSD